MSGVGTVDWVKRSKYRNAVYQATLKPRTGKAIFNVCRQSCPCISYQDIRHSLRQLEGRGFVKCLNPQQQTGRLYVACGPSVDVCGKLSADYIDCLSIILRGKSKEAILKKVSERGLGEFRPKTANQLRRELLGSYPMSLSWAISTLKSLTELDLVEIAGRTRKRDLKTYAVTGKGARICEIID